VKAKTYKQWMGAAVVVVGLMMGLAGCGSTTFELEIEANPKDGGSVSPKGAIKYKAGTEITVTATANEGYRFTGWSGASTFSDESVTVTINSNQTLVANFEKITFELEIETNPKDGGSVSHEGTVKYDMGTEVEVTATANEGYRFAGWSGASTSSDESVTVTINSNQTLVANFEKITFELEVETNPKDGGSV
jgi:uncharacterized repeat protein (TIGR02543 family)